MEVHHPVFYVSLRHMQNSMRSNVTLKLKLKLTLNLTLTDTGGAVLTLMLGYRPGGELPRQTIVCIQRDNYSYSRQLSSESMNRLIVTVLLTWCVM